MRMALAMVAGLVTAAAPALAEIEARTLFVRRAWEVQVVRFEDGAVSCVAQVTRPGVTFSVWADNVNPVKLQFHSTAWDFGTGSTANLIVQIDRRGPWNLSNAELYLHPFSSTCPTTRPARASF